MAQRAVLETVCCGFESYLRCQFVSFAQSGIRHGAATSASLVRIQQDAPYEIYIKCGFNAFLPAAYDTFERFIISHFFYLGH